MHTIIYISLYRPSETSPELDLKKICQSAVKNNGNNNISGVLLFHNNHFLQVLEGEQEIVKSTLDQIRRDARHADLEVIIDEPINKRCFPDWRMQLFNLSHPSRFSSSTLKKIKEIYSHNFEFNATDFLFLLNSLLNDQAFLDELND